MRTLRVINASLPLIAAACVSQQSAVADSPWLNLVKENDRIVAADSLGIADIEQKRYVWGDVNNNGWVDLVVVRKQPFTSAGKRVNVLFINEDGTLFDRTSEYASAVAHEQIVTEPGWPSHDAYPADEGFHTPTNDRSAALADLTSNGWLDLVTSPAISDGDPKHIGHPRVYVNLANDERNNWQGFRFENARIPAMLTWSGLAGHNPRFGDVAAGDVTGNGYADLYFSDHDSSGAGGVSQPAGADFNDRFLINAGASSPGYFADETAARFAGVVSIPSQTNQPFPISAMGWRAAIADVNGSGFADIVKLSALSNPLYVGVAYNHDAVPNGHFDSADYQAVTSSNVGAYHFSLADLNNNGRLDIVVTTAFTDRYLLNLATLPNGHVQWSSPVLLPQQNIGFGSNSVVIDLDNSGWNDIIIADTDADIGPCLSNRRANMYRNNHDAPSVTFVNASDVLSSDERRGVYDVAAFDLTGNGWNDLVFGRCTSTDVWINVPPSLLCPADLTGSGNVGVGDLLALLGAWGACPDPVVCPADLTGSGSVGVADLLVLLQAWGTCP